MMEPLTIAPDQDIESFFRQAVPAAVQRFLDEQPAPGMEGTAFHLRFTVADGGTWGLTVHDGRTVEMHDGKRGSHLAVEFDERSLRHSHRPGHRGLDLIRLIHGDRARFNRLQKVHGTVDLRLKDHHVPLNVVVRFHDAQAPYVRVRMRFPDFCDLVEHKTSGPKLLLRGRLKPKGDMGLLWKTQTVL